MINSLLQEQICAYLCLILHYSDKCLMQYQHHRIMVKALNWRRHLNVFFIFTSNNSRALFQEHLEEISSNWAQIELKNELMRFCWLKVKVQGLVNSVSQKYLEGLSLHVA